MFEEIDFKTLEFNPFSTLADEGFLITAGDKNKFNTMTATWGFFGNMWSKPTYAIVVRPTRYTYQFLEKHNQFSVSFFPLKYYATLQFLGSNSGRDFDKLAKTELNPIFLEGEDNKEFITYKEANMVICCTKVSRVPLTSDHFLTKEIEEHYPQKDYHTLYMGFIDKIVVQDF
ncbi:MAG: flavin reductase [Sphaerochaetaceae bacterium]